MPADPLALLRSRSYLRLLAIAAVLGRAPGRAPEMSSLCWPGLAARSGCRADPALMALTSEEVRDDPSGPPSAGT